MKKQQWRYWQDPTPMLHRIHENIPKCPVCDAAAINEALKTKLMMPVIIGHPHWVIASQQSGGMTEVHEIFSIQITKEQYNKIIKEHSSTK